MFKAFAAIKGWISDLLRIGKSVLGRERDMVRIRLRRQGSKGQPSYRIVVTDQRRARNGKYLENIGHYNPRTRPATEIIKEDRALYWLGVGAQPSDAVRRILDHTGTWARFQRMRAGESMEDLVNEADEDRGELPSPRTNYPSPRDGESKLKRREAARNASADEPSQQPPEEPEKDNHPPTVPKHADQQPDDIDDPSRPHADKSEENRPGTESDKAAEEPDAVEVVEQQPCENQVETPNTGPAAVDLYNNLNRPGKTQLKDEFIPPRPSPTPEYRRNRKQEGFVDAIRKEPEISKRTRQVLTKRWERKDEATREFLKQQYGGCCQICSYTFPKYDGEPYFEGLYIESHTQGSFLDDPANVLCLCANHCAQFLHGAREFNPDFREQVLSYESGDHHILKLELIGQNQEIRFSQRHIIDLKAIVEATGST